MKVAFVTHQLAFYFFGGAEISMLKTQEFLEQFGVNVKFFNMYSDKIDDYDIIHIFNPGAFPNEALKFIRIANQRNVKTVVSTIFWFSYRSAIGFSSSFPIKILKTFMYHKSLWHFTRKFHTFYNLLSMIFNEADTLIISSLAEMKMLKEYFGVNSSKCTVVPFGIDEAFKQGDSSLFLKYYGLKDFILYVGRIEARKNVLGLIRAFKESNLNTHLVIIGNAEDRSYYARCREEANKKVVFIGPLEHDDPLLRSAYYSAKVFALPSFFEWPGIAALEGALASDNIVITSEGSTHEYFGDYAWYVEPTDIKKIAEALKEAYIAPRRTELRKIVEKKFTWKISALKIFDLYKQILNGHKSS